MTLYFSEAQMKTFLEKKGYMVDKVTTITYIRTYYGNEEDSYKEIWVAVKNKKELKLCENSNTEEVERECGLKKVFHDEMVKTLLQL